jgi:cell division protein FtsA
VPKGSCIVGIDIGTTKVCAAIGETTRYGGIRIIGVGTAPSKGLRKGVIVNIDDAVQSIGLALDRAERLSGHRITNAFLSISGGQIASLNNRGVIAIAHRDRAIGTDDVERVIEAARVINVPNNREIIHSIPRQFIVDGQEGVKNPTGMIGYRLDVETHIITAAVTSVQNLTKCVHRLGVDVEGVVLEPLASGEAVLTDEEKEMGVVLADIGGGTTGISIYVEGSVWHTAILPIGGNHITNDVAIGLRTPFATAEEIKVSYANVLNNDTGSAEEIEVTTFGRSQSDRISRAELCEIVEARLAEMFSFIQEEIKNSGYDNLLPAGVVLTGGGAQLDGIADLAAASLNLPVRIGLPYDVDGLVDSINGPAYAAVVGLLLWENRQGPQSAMRSLGTRHISRNGGENGTEDETTMVGRIGGWLKAFLP